MPTADVLLTPLNLEPAYAAVVERVRRSIALGVVLPGERLPSERTLAERLGVSRVTVREALRVLQGEGLIVTRRGGAGGAVVTQRETSIERLREEFGRSRPRIDHVFEFRVAVEGMAARLAAERRDDADLARLAECQEALAGSGGVDSFRRADSAFHLTIAEASGNPLLRQSIEDARAAAFEWLDIQPFKVLRESSLAGHAAVVAAIELRSGTAAAEAMTAHLVQAHEEVLAALGGEAPAAR